MIARATDAAAELCALVRATGLRSIAVVGTAKNSGKTTAVAALCDQLQRRREGIAVCTVGRDGESFDAIEGSAKPRIALRAGATLATAATLATRHPALEILEVTAERGALGPIVIARVCAAGEYELAGPSSSAGMRRVVRRLGEAASVRILDGAIDRVSVVSGGDDAIVVAAGATSPTFAASIEDARACVARLRLARVDGARPSVRIDGALTVAGARELITAGERRQVVVEDGTKIAFAGRTFLALAQRLDLRCERVLRVVACTVAASHPRRAFDAPAFLNAIADVTHVPTFDLYANRAAS